MASAEIALLLVRRTAVHRRYVAVLARLSAGQASLQELIDVSALSRRGVEELLREAGEDVVLDSAEEGGAARWSLRPQAQAEYAAVLAATPSPEPGSGLVSYLREARARGPKPNKDLDHVAATAETIAARAAWIARRFETKGLRVLFVGDHDLTSLALARLCPGAQIAVVDIDEGLLEFLAGELSAVGAESHLRHADLRRRLPADLEGWADLFVTDPPYTPDGVALFCARGAQSLRSLPYGRGLLAYGYGEDQPALGLAVQKAALGLDCVIEELIPDFNRYHGAQAIGSASDWHVLRFAPSAAKKVERFLAKAPQAIYTHGRQSVEAGATGQDKETGRSEDLRKQDASALFRALVWGRGERLALLVDNNHPDLRSAESQARLAADVAGRWNLKFRKSVPDNASAVVEAVAQPEPSPRAAAVPQSPAGWVLARPEGKLKNVLREAWIHAHGEAMTGPVLTKNEARRSIGDILAASGPWGEGMGECLVGDAPRAALRAVLAAFEEKREESAR